MSNWRGNQGTDLRETDRSLWIPRLDVDPRFGPICIDNIIDNFHGDETGFLSNFFQRQIIIDNLEYSSNEHYYQAKKPIEGAVDDKGQLWSEKIRLAKTPGQSKKLGRSPCPLRPDWDRVKFRYMKGALIAKFNGTELEEKLLATKNAYLVEANVWHDGVWGICIKRNCERGCGQKRATNYLGLFLMELRQILEENKV